jgi:GNAT superfamily N-acetyltransferase
MELTDVALRRTQMGRGIGRFADAPGMTLRVEDDWWLALTGLPSADANMVLVHGEDPLALDEAVATVSAANGGDGVPCLLMLAGEARAMQDRLPADWNDVGTMPIMGRDLADVDADHRDDRVRRLRPEDAPVVAELLAEAYGIAPDVMTIVTDAGSRDDAGFQTWLLEDEGLVVSSVTTCRTDDAVSVWVMGTPSRYARRGFGRALLATVLAEARHDGAALGLLGATPAGLPLYESTGWVTFEEWQINVNATSAQFEH